MSYKCSCGWPLIPVRIGLEEKGVLKGTICFKQWCPHCRNSRLTQDGQILYYTIKTDGGFTMDKMQFWVPESVPFQYKAGFIATVLKLAFNGRFEGKQNYTMAQIREAYKAGGNNGN